MDRQLLVEHAKALFASREWALIRELLAASDRDAVERLRARYDDEAAAMLEHNERFRNMFRFVLPAGERTKDPFGE